MNRHSITAALVVAIAFVVAGTEARAADATPVAKSAAGMSGMGDKSKHHAMMEGMKDSDGGMGGGDMKGMMGMMGMMNSYAMMPMLPPGNEKLQFQMQAEMMQKMGEIAAKYADRIKEAK